jgi:hypothetical protein
MQKEVMARVVSAGRAGRLYGNPRPASARLAYLNNSTVLNCVLRSPFLAASTDYAISMQTEG